MKVEQPRKEKNAIQTKHNLDFGSRPWERGFGIQVFRIGSCEGQWMCTESAYCIISVINNNPGNGHLDDVFEWFEFACKRDGKALMVLECMNERFKAHLLQKRDFLPARDNDVIKIFHQNK